MTAVCPACGQPIFIRHGVKLQRKKAAILDVIEKYTKHEGIDLDRLAWLLYPDDPKPIARQRLKVHIVNRDGRYRLSGVA